VAHLLLALGEADLSDQPSGYVATNVGTGIEYSAEEIIETLRDLTGTPIEIKQRANRARAVDKLHQRADTTRLMTLTGTSARHDLRQGLSKLLAHEQLPMMA
jgi:UDP-glucose 4-epimerase